jgi:hypothetical protein
VKFLWRTGVKEGTGDDTGDGNRLLRWLSGAFKSGGFECHEACRCAVQSLRVRQTAPWKTTKAALPWCWKIVYRAAGVAGMCSGPAPNSADHVTMPCGLKGHSTLERYESRRRDLTSVQQQ